MAHFRAKWILLGASIGLALAGASCSLANRPEPPEGSTFRATRSNLYSLKSGQPATEHAVLGEPYRVLCEYETPLDHVVAYAGEEPCSYAGQVGVASAFRCAPSQSGTVINYCATSAFINPHGLNTKIPVGTTHVHPTASSLLSYYYPALERPNRPFEVEVTALRSRGCEIVEMEGGQCFGSAGASTFRCLSGAAGYHEITYVTQPIRGCQISRTSLGTIQIAQPLRELESSAFPTTAEVDKPFTVECDFGVRGTDEAPLYASLGAYDQIQAGTIRYEQTKAIMTIVPTVTGRFDVYCNLGPTAPWLADKRAKVRLGSIKINSRPVVTPPEQVPVSRKLSGSFFFLLKPDGKTPLRYDRAAWRREFEALHRAGMDTLVLFLFPPAVYPPSEDADAKPTSDQLAKYNAGRAQILAQFELSRAFFDALYEYWKNNPLWKPSLYLYAPHASGSSNAGGALTRNDVWANMIYLHAFMDFYLSNYAPKGDILDGFWVAPETMLKNYDWRAHIFSQSLNVWIRKTYPSRKIMMAFTWRYPVGPTDLERDIRNLGTHMGRDNDVGYPGTLVDYIAFEDQSGGLAPLQELKEAFPKLVRIKEYGIQAWSILETFSFSAPYTLQERTNNNDRNLADSSPLDIEIILQKLRIEQGALDPSAKILTWNYQYDMSPLPIGRTNEFLGLQSQLYTKYVAAIEPKLLGGTVTKEGGRYYAYCKLAERYDKCTAARAGVNPLASAGECLYLGRTESGFARFDCSAAPQPMREGTPVYCISSPYMQSDCLLRSFRVDPPVYGLKAP